MASQVVCVCVLLCACITDVCVGPGSQQQSHTVALVVQTAVVQRRVSCWRLHVHVGAEGEENMQVKKTKQNKKNHTGVHRRNTQGWNHT